MRLTLKTEALPILLILATWVLVAWYWPHLPDPMPTHWGVNGQPDGWMPRFWGAIVGPLTSTLVYLMMTLSPYIDPRSRNWAAFGNIYPVLKTSVTALMLFVTYLALTAAASTDQVLPASRLLVAIGLLFIVLGNYLPKVRSNFFVGIRTPWTLSSDEVWVRTHRLAGKLMVALGLLILLCTWLPGSWAAGIVIGASLALTAVTFVYSYWLYRRQAKP
ncbi:Immunity protein SdpI [compost metagenome]